MSSTITPSSRVMAAYCASPTSSAETSLVVRRSVSAVASGPATSISPMCETSKIPASSRTAVCSARIESNSTGMSHPPNSVNVAPRSA